VDWDSIDDVYRKSSIDELQQHEIRRTIPQSELGPPPLANVQSSSTANQSLREISRRSMMSRGESERDAVQSPYNLTGVTITNPAGPGPTMRGEIAPRVRPTGPVPPSTPVSERPKVDANTDATDSHLPHLRMMTMSDGASARRVVSTAGTTETKPDPQFGEKLTKRSGGRCELTGRMEDVGLVTEGAHIFGLATATEGRSDIFWQLLYMFWDVDIVEALQKDCRDHINDVSNGISMDIMTHRLYDKLHFYLEVVPGSFLETETTAQYSVKIRFPRSTISLNNFWASQEHTADDAIYTRQFRDGDEITFKTDDVKNYPLPDPILLQLRAILTKCAFLQGGGDQEEVYLSKMMLEEQAYLSNMMLEEQMRAVSRPDLIDSLDEYDSEAEFGMGGYDSPDLYEYGAATANTGRSLLVESWLDNVDVNRTEVRFQEEPDGTTMEDSQLGEHQGTRHS
jgi:hypothetical protein